MSVSVIKKEESPEPSVMAVPLKPVTKSASALDGPASLKYEAEDAKPPKPKPNSIVTQARFRPLAYHGNYPSKYSLDSHYISYVPTYTPPPLPMLSRFLSRSSYAVATARGSRDNNTANITTSTVHTLQRSTPVQKLERKRIQTQNGRRWRATILLYMLTSQMGCSFLSILP
jgi:hypothetical protein